MVYGVWYDWAVLNCTGSDTVMSDDECLHE